MHKVTYRITTQSPALFVMNVGDTNMVATRDYIPGSVIMGLFAGEYIRKHSLGSNAHTNPAFYQGFLKGEMRFTNACVVSQNEREQFQKYFPVPFSIQHPKNNENTFSDLLFSGADSVKQPVYKAGFGRMEGDGLYLQQVNKSLNFHHKRDPETGTVKKGMIFNYESMDANQTFEGSILGICEALQEVLALFPHAQTTHIGRSRNAQYGKIRFEFLSKRLEEFISEIDEFSANELSIENGEISLTLLSNTIIYNSNGLSTTEITELERQLKSQLGDMVFIKKAFIKTDEVENFISVWRMRRPSEVCFKAGSCFLLAGIMPEQKDKLPELQKNGIGERRGEGFGRIVFGWQREERKTLTLGKAKKKKAKKPEGGVPEATRGIVQAIVRDFIRSRVEIDALRDANDFVNEKQENKGLPSKSLIGRMEAMVTLLDKDAFRKALDEDLRKTARDKLEACKDRQGRQTLFEYLMKHPGEKTLVEKFFAGTDHGISEARELCKEIGFDPESDKNLEDELFHRFFQTFFSEMRRILRKG